MKHIVKNIWDKDPAKQIDRRRFSTGRVLSVGGNIVEIEVGAKLPNGEPVTLKVPGAEGFAPSIGAVVALHYPSTSLHSAYVVSLAQSPVLVPRSAQYNGAPITPTDLTAPNAVFSISLHVTQVWAGAVLTTKQAATKNKSGKVLTVLGVTAFAAGKSGSSDPTVDVYEGASSILSAPLTLAAQETVYDIPVGSGTPHVDDASIAIDGELSVRVTTAAEGSIEELTVVVWCKAAHV